MCCPVLFLAPSLNWETGRRQVTASKSGLTWLLWHGPLAAATVSIWKIWSIRLLFWAWIKSGRKQIIFRASLHFSYVPGKFWALDADSSLSSPFCRGHCGSRNQSGGRAEFTPRDQGHNPVRCQIWALSARWCFLVALRVDDVRNESEPLPLRFEQKRLAFRKQSCKY